MILLGKEKKKKQRSVVADDNLTHGQQENMQATIDGSGCEVDSFIAESRRTL